MTPARRRRRRWLWGLVVAALAVWLAAAALDAVAAVAAARDGKRAADAAKAAASPEDLVTGKPLADLRRARARFASAHHRLRSPLLAPVRVLPVLGRQLRSADGVTGAAEEVADIGAGAVGEAQRVLNQPHRTGPDRVVLLRRLADTAARADARLDGLDLGPRTALLSPLRHAHDQLADQLNRLRDGLAKGSAGAHAAADLLAGPRRYLLLGSNNSEMRDGQGMFLSAGLLQTVDGQLHLEDFRSTPDLTLPPGAVVAPPELAEHWGFARPTEDMRNLGMSPRFDATAPVAARMWAAAGNPPVDGVLAIDPLGLQAVLAAVGPVQVGDQRIGGDNVVDYLLHGQYVRHAQDEGQARKEELGTIAHAAMGALQDREWSVGQLGKGLATAARGRHLLAWSSRREEQDAWRAAGVDGALSDDSFALGVISTSGNKLDHFVQVRADLVTHPNGAGTSVEIRVHVENTVPPGEPAYVSGRDPKTGLADEVYGGILALNLPDDAQRGRVDGVDHLVALGPDGPTRLVATSFTLKRGEQRTLVARFELRRAHGTMRVLPTARVPGVSWSFNAAPWADGSAHVVRW